MRHFDELLQDVSKRIIMMGSLVESMIATAVRAYTEQSDAVSAEVFEKERQVNATQIEIDEKCVQLIATQAPVASDVRFLFMGSRISGELERIADQTINICQNSHYVNAAGSQISPLVDVQIMAQVAAGMVRKSLGAMIGRDVSLAEQVLQEEEQVDAFRDQIFRIVLTHMMSDPRTIQQGMSLILIARNIERIGDHATNIAEEVIYWIQGRDVRHGKPVRPVGSPPSPPPDGSERATMRPMSPTEQTQKDKL
ncbi:MAG TPA: phosphate signaling complex protein PhoU [Tepidisphaeraceae bacterium]|nr:phosphate signaling complex protein PhoU [Tepidisphaeraceae bacterium]